MILTGQKYTNEPRVYWHGSIMDRPNIDRESTCIFVTMCPEYAVCFANPIICAPKLVENLEPFSNSKHDNRFNVSTENFKKDSKDFGTLVMFKQERPLNILNINSKDGSKVFTEIAFELWPTFYSKYTKRLYISDWIWVRYSSKRRNELINAIKERGYDGFLDYGGYPHHGLYRVKGGIASMGLFNPESIGHSIQKSGREILRFDDISKIHSADTSNLLEDVFIFMKRGYGKKKIIETALFNIRELLKYTTVLEEDIERVYEEVSSGKVPESARIKEALENNGEYHYGWDGQLTEKLW